MPAPMVVPATKEILLRRLFEFVVVEEEEAVEEGSVEDVVVSVFNLVFNLFAGKG